MKIVPFLRRKPAASETTPADKPKTRAEQVRQAGQIIAIFALALTALIGLVGIAIDITFAWREELRIQRAADAASLAGVVYLPGNVPGGQSAAGAEATKNGYTSGVANTTVSASQGTANARQMDVVITTRVPTFFMRTFGVSYFTVSRSSKAVYILPVPMGSPDNYYGVYGDYKFKTSSSGSDTTVPMTSPSGGSVTGRGFWATMLTQGSTAANGDAYLPKVLNDNNTGTNGMHDTTNYYDYSIYMPPGSSNGHVWLFDPVFCATDNKHGAGDYYLSGTPAVASYYKLYNTNNQPYNLAAHTPVGSGTSGSMFASNQYTDNNNGGPSTSSTLLTCTGTFAATDARSTHNKWWDLTGYLGATLSGGTGGTTYRLRTTTDPGNSSQDSVNAYNNFAIYTTASGGTAQVSGLGAMEMFTPLPAGTSSTFYLAQIDAQSGAGKTVEINLWDPGDTQGLTANIQILQPTSSGWSAVSSMTWTATKVATVNVGTCPAGSGSSIQTANGSTKIYNGCWLKILIVLPTTYTAPQSGWWKITYIMGSGTAQAADLTTWQVNIRGNPVHLIPG
jgi:hypothetical protein